MPTTGSSRSATAWRSSTRRPESGPSTSPGAPLTSASRATSRATSRGSCPSPSRSSLPSRTRAPISTNTPRSWPRYPERRMRSRRLSWALRIGVPSTRWIPQCATIPSGGRSRGAHTFEGRASRRPRWRWIRPCGRPPSDRRIGRVGVGAYESAYRRSLDEREAFWREAAAAVEWHSEPQRILDDSKPPFYRWFPDGVLNTCANAVDRHADGGRADQPALVYDSPVTATTRVFTYGELREEVPTLAGAMARLGVGKGDTVVIYMPMVPEAVFAMLACARLGAIHSVVFGGFAAHELAVRIDDARPKLILSGSCGIEIDRVIEYKPLLDRALDEAAHQPDHCVILQRARAEAELVPGRDLEWREFTAGAAPVPCTSVSAIDPLYILYTSGTTGLPKGVVRDNGGHAVALRWSMEAIYDTHPGEVFWAASDLGWAVGHSYIVYAPLLTGCTTILYEGKPVGTPDPGAFWRVIAQHGVKVLFTAPTAFRAIKKEDPGGSYLAGHDLAEFASLFLAGERLDPDTYHWASQLLGVPVIDHWWQTESGWPMAANCLGLEPLPVKAGSPSKPVPGYDIRIVDESGGELGADVEGSVAVRLP